MSRSNILKLKKPSLLCSETSFYFQTLMKVKRFAEVLLHQQLWFFGKDIKTPNKNLLVNYGFKQIRPPKEMSGSTNYICKLGVEANVILWGFGIYYGYGSNKGVYIGRYNVSPKLIHNEPLSLPIWDTSELPEMKSPKSVEEWEYSFRLMSELFEWMSHYEEWVNGVMGASYRDNCLKDWDQFIVSGGEMAWAWSRVANFFENSNEKLFQTPKEWNN